MFSSRTCIMDQNEAKSVDLDPRPYQSQVLELALMQNTIVFLPTGAGKTYIAVMLIKKMGAAVEKPFSAGGKRTFFLVNTVALAEQQKSYIKRHTCLSVGHYTGDMKVDYWEGCKWREELDKNQVLKFIEDLEKNQVLVMTAQILLDILMHSYLKLQDINLIVFDECHHAVNDHCMSKILNLFKECALSERPRVLGLTASLLNATVKYDRVRETVTALEEKFYSKVATVENVMEVESYSTNPYERHVPFDEPQIISLLEEIKKHIENISEFISNFEFEEDQVNAPNVPGAEYQAGKKLRKRLCNRLSDVWYHVHTLGIYGGSLATLKLIMHIEILRSRAENSETMLVYSAINTTLSMIRKMMEDHMKGSSEETKIYKFSTPQVLTLLEVLKKYKSEDVRGIIFVERRLTAKVLFLILRAALQAYLRDVESNADYTSQLLNKELNAEKSKQGNSSSFVECDTCLAKECEDNLEAWKAKEWYEAVSDEGYKYFWNTLSGESVWEPPAQGYISIDEQKKAESKEVEKLSKNKEKEDIRRKEEEIRKRKEEEKAKAEEERSRSEREKMKSIAVKDNPEPPRTFFGPAPKGNPYGLWTTIKAKRNEPVDLQLPQQGHTFKASETVISEPEVKFKEKNFSNMQVEGNDTFFKKRKWNSNTKRNMRRRLDDD